ncbi:uroporphyrinogen decarboxylase family protein [Anaerocolumna jejuensis]|nr:uroporphyrinogen decarboxylase family protein [Anaerocolumna jejuensis]
MTKKERVLRSLNNKKVDKVPVGFWFHFPEDMDLKKECVDATIRFYKDSDVDFIKIMCDGYFDYPNEIIPKIKKPEDWFLMKPLGENHPFIEEQVKRAKEIVEKLNGECCVFYNVFCPMTSFRFGTSDELLMDHLRKNPEAVMYAFDVIAKDADALCRRLIKEAGCDGVYYCVQNAEEYRFTVEEYNRYVRPSDLYVLEHANEYSENNILHCCGWAGDKNRIEVWRDYPAKAINWAVYIEEMTLNAGKEFFHGRCVLGGFDNRPTGILYAGTKDEIEEFTEQLVKESGTKGVMIGADCSLPRDIDKNHIKWVVEKLKSLI